MNMGTIEINKHYRARNGREVRIICTDARGMFPIVGLIDINGGERPVSYLANGRHDIRSNVRTPFDLVLELEEEGGEE